MYLLNGHIRSLSILVVSTFLLWYAAVLGSLTILTHIAQLLALQFRFYSVLALSITIGVSIGVVLFAQKRNSTSPVHDFRTLLFVLFLGVAAAVVSTSIRRVGRIAPEEYLYGANPVYFLEHPNARMGFEDRTLYSGNGPFVSVSYHTAGAYEYVLGAFALLLELAFVTGYYRLAALVAGFAFPLALFLVLTYFSETTPGAAVGTFFSILFIAMLGETSWAPGAYSFPRIFEGKIIFLFVGVLLFIYFSLELLKLNNFTSWIQLFMLNTAAAGLSSTSIMVLPILGTVLFCAFWTTFPKKIKSQRDLLIRFVPYISSFAYLVVFATFVVVTDTLKQGLLINAGESDRFVDYLSGFVNTSFPITPLLVILSSLAVLVLTNDKTRLFLATWMLFAILFALNPMAGQILLTVFPGIYFRLFYVFPFLVNLGVLFSCLFLISSRSLSRGRNSLLWSGLGIVALTLVLLLPSSILREDRFVMGSTAEDEDLVLAQTIVRIAPEGVTLAPYPLSGAINMIDSDYPQLISRVDNMVYLLDLQGREDELDLRLDASAFLSEERVTPEGFIHLVEQYPEIRSIVLPQRQFTGNLMLRTFLIEEGFLNSKRFRGWLLIWR